jgi:hypothetical protein
MAALIARGGMIPTVQGWRIAKQQTELKGKVLEFRNEEPYHFNERCQALGEKYCTEDLNREEKKSLIAQMMFFADRELYRK